ncbi:unnamed protein product [Pleuronectes platessa]|uniref:Uncharacterized protein n=1 Tax=Pleuronectes platessa TaxID=8262 RepID=A0A9N7UH05_PLEPL|nr:unnamed protein product [Pleuronectes platessa]
MAGSSKRGQRWRAEGTGIKVESNGGYNPLLSVVTMTPSPYPLSSLENGEFVPENTDTPTERWQRNCSRRAYIWWNEQTISVSQAPNHHIFYFFRKSTRSGVENHLRQ